MTDGIDYDEGSEEPGAAGARSTGNVGFMIDGIDLRNVGPDDIHILIHDDSFQEFELDDEEAPDSESHQSPQLGKGGNSLVPLWPEDLVPPDRSDRKPRAAKTEGSLSQHRLVQEYHARASNRRFCITANQSMYFPQMSFGTGVKYSGNVSLSQISMIVLLSARNVALRVHAREIGCEHILIALIDNHGFAAGQLLLSLHLNGIGRPRALGDLQKKARKALRNHSGDFDLSTATGVSDDDSVFGRGENPLLGGGAVDMCFTHEAEQLLVESMHVAAEAGCPQVSTKHLLVALAGADSTTSEEMLRELSISKSEIRNALAVCPETDDSREFVTYFLCSIVHSIIRFRLFPGPVRKYKQYSVKKSDIKK